MSYRDHILYVFGVHPHHERDTQHTLLGKLWLKDGNLSVLEDHGMSPPHDLSTMPPDKAARIIKRFGNSQRRKLVTAEELRQGHHPELLPSADRARLLPNDLQEAIQDQLKDQEAGPKVSLFDYHREGMPGPQSLKVHGDQLFLDDHPLAPEEVKQVMSNIQNGKAAIRHQLKKTEVLAKIEPHLTAALGQVREAVRNGHVHPDALKTLNRTLFTDSMVPTVGNKIAYNDFLSRPRAGVHVRIDGNSFGRINKVHGFDVGNNAIIAFFKAARAAADESVGRKNAKLFRIGGDEAHLHVPTPEHAAAFARAFRAKLEAIPAVRGEHRLSASMGWGSSPDNAEAALIAAKGQKKASGKVPGQEETHAAGHPEFSSPSGSGIR